MYIGACVHTYYHIEHVMCISLIQSLLERVENLQKLCDKKEKFLQVHIYTYSMHVCLYVGGSHYIV